ncbi:hypothetical protein EV401DRAFT_1883078 [Pisolithus croceorrhizus]|nr:hypothetical protein EV401DRAFT_1883078 [Pisolithus croceorrhizus]
MSQFAVNLFTELPRLPDQGLANPVVNYLGMFVMQYMDNIFTKWDAWNNIVEDTKNNLFIYTKFDGHLIGCANQIPVEVQVVCAMAQLKCNQAEGIKCNGSSHFESDAEMKSDSITSNDFLLSFDFDALDVEMKFLTNAFVDINPQFHTSGCWWGNGFNMKRSRVFGW